MAFIYIIYSDTKKTYYKGSTKENNPIIRLKIHNSGKVKSTKSGIPWWLIYEEQYDNFILARKRENFLKSGVGRKWIKEKFCV